MSFDLQKLYDLLPAIYRVRDVEQGEPLKRLLAVVAGEVAVLEEDIEQLYDDQFIETSADWVVPYIGDLIGYRTLNGVIPQIASPRTEVANTIAYRRRKGTIAVLEELAYAVTGWDAHAVEFFRLLATTQYMNHIRPGNLATPHMGRGVAFAKPESPPNWERLERLGSAFESTAHTADVRHISNCRGKYNIPNIGIFLWRLRAYPVTESPAAKIDDHRYMFSSLGNNSQLFNSPVTRTQVSELAVPRNVPELLSRRVLREYLRDQYGRSIVLKQNGAIVDLADVVVCNLSDAGSGWAHEPGAGKIAIDPVLGRIALNTNDDVPESLLVSYHYGFSSDLGGGEYARAKTFSGLPDQEVSAEDSIQQALDTVMPGGGVVQIQDSARYEESLGLAAGKDATVELRATNGARPHIELGGDFKISGSDTSQVVLNGLLISGKSLRVNGNLGTLVLRHCTLVPGLELDIDGVPQSPATPSLIINSSTTHVEIDHCIIGGIRANPEASIAISNSIVDATDETEVAFAGLDGETAGGALTVDDSTVIGKVHTRTMQVASNTIFFAALSAADTWNAPVLSERKQEGCVRFSYVPPGSRTPRRFMCQPALNTDAMRVRPQFTSLRYSEAGYCQLSRRCASEIRTGADDEAEMGAFHELFQPQREKNLLVRLDEYLRLGLEAGIFYAT